MRNSDQILGNRALVADTIVHVCKAETVDLGDIESVFEILEATVE